MKIHKSPTIALFLIFISLSITQAQEFNWTKGFGGGNTDYGNAVITDSRGNIYLTGEFYTSLTIAPLPTITSSGNVDYYLAKMDSLGNGIWVRKGGGTLTDRGFGVRLDQNGNIISTGVLYGVCTFEGGGNPNVVLTSAGNLDGFIAKYDTAGNLLWIKQATSVSQVSVRKSIVDNDNNIIVSGYFGTTNIDTVRIDTVTIHGAGQRDAFIVKLDANGNVLWGKNIGSPQSSEEGKTLAVDNNNNIYVCGFFSGPVDLGGGVTLTSAGLEDAFVIKYSPSGSAIWAKSFGGIKNDEAYGLLLDNSGNIVVGGNFDSAAVFGTNNLVSAGGYDAYIMKLDPSGNVLWIKQGGGTEADYGFDVAKSPEDNFYLTGQFRTTANFSGTNITSAGAEDMYMAAYNSAGDLINLKRGGGTGIDKGLADAIDAGGNVMVTGRFAGTATFGTTQLTSAGGDDIFLTKIGDHFLPVELVSFTSNIDGRNVNLQWSTATEMNNKGFEIQRRSNNDFNWITLGFINGKGSSSSYQSYSFTDKNLVSGRFAYRLKQMDFDGSFRYSKIVDAEISIPGNFLLNQNYPNPFNPSTTIDYQIPVESKVKLEIYSVTGARVAEIFNKEQAAGYYSVQIKNQLTGISSGVYLYKLIAVSSQNGKTFYDVKKLIFMK